MNWRVLLVLYVCAEAPRDLGEMVNRRLKPSRTWIGTGRTGFIGTTAAFQVRRRLNLETWTAVNLIEELMDIKNLIIRKYLSRGRTFRYLFKFLYLQCRFCSTILWNFYCDVSFRYEFSLFCLLVVIAGYLSNIAFKLWCIFPVFFIDDFKLI